MIATSVHQGISLRTMPITSLDPSAGVAVAVGVACAAQATEVDQQG